MQSLQTPPLKWEDPIYASEAKILYWIRSVCGEFVITHANDFEVFLETGDRITICKFRGLEQAMKAASIFHNPSLAEKFIETQCGTYLAQMSNGKTIGLGEYHTTESLSRARKLIATRS